MPQEINSDLKQQLLDAFRQQQEAEVRPVDKDLSQRLDENLQERSRERALDQLFESSSSNEMSFPGLEPATSSEAPSEREPNFEAEKEQALPLRPLPLSSPSKQPFASSLLGHLSASSASEKGEMETESQDSYASAPQEPEVTSRYDSETRESSVKQSGVSGGPMADLSGYKDLSKAPFLGDEGNSSSDESSSLSGISLASPPAEMKSTNISLESLSELRPPAETEFSGNVQTLIRLVSELPEWVTKQTGAQIIRLTMEAMGISMEEVLSEAQSAQSEMLDAVRANIKKIEEFKTVIRKLEADIKFYQGKANELSEIIDLFILSNTTSGRVPTADELSN